MSQISDAEMATIVEKLNNDACDTFMKYVYYFMDKNYNQSSMLKIHALLVDKVGSGCIIRTLTDRLN